jgi:phenylacetate-CoA ligase
MKNQLLSREELLKLQEEGLRQIVEHAYYTVPFYNFKFKQIGIKPTDIKDLEDLNKLPIITREDVKKNYTSFISREYIKKYDFGEFVERMTSGTTSMPFKIIFDYRTKDYYDAIFLRSLILSGYRPWQKIAFYGSPMPKKFYEKLGFVNKIYISPSLSIDKQIEILRKTNPDVIIYYPGALYFIAKKMLFDGISNIKPKFIISQGELLTENMRNLVEKAFVCKLYDWYGMNEFVNVAWQCKYKNYHINDDALILECVDNGKNTRDKTGNFVITSLVNYMFPLIRYKTGDIGKITNKKCNCSKSFSIIKEIEGREYEFINKGKRKILIKKLLNEIINIEGLYKFKLKVLNHEFIQLYCVPFDQSFKKNISERIKNLPYKTYIKFVHDIKPSKEGKFNLVTIATL